MNRETRHERQDVYERMLFEHVVEPWFPRCVDHDRGGFLSGFDAAWNLVDDGSKLLEFQARQTLAAAELAIAYPALTVARDAARHGMACLRDQLWDHEYGGWYLRLDPDGVGGGKHLHGMAYAVSACLAVHCMDGDTDALRLTHAAIDWIDTHAHDDRHGGYHAVLRRDGQPVRPGDDDAPATDHIGTPVGTKEMNVHGDLLEAVSAAYTVTGDQRYRRRVEELVGIVLHAADVEDGWFVHDYDRSWRRASRRVRPPTIMQNASRLLEARAILGEEHKLEAAAFRLFGSAMTSGWSEPCAAVLEENDAGRSPDDCPQPEFSWWSQFEALKIVEYLYRLTPDDARLATLRRRIARTIQADFVDARHRGLFSASGRAVNGCDAEDRPDWRGDRTRKGHDWKDASHDVRVLLRLVALDGCLDAVDPLVPRIDRPLPTWWPRASSGGYQYRIEGRAAPEGVL